jgi:hypothetical protein
VNTWVELCAATADAFEFAGNRFKRVDRSRIISPFESGEAVRHGRHELAGRISAVSRESSICRAPPARHCPPRPARAHVHVENAMPACGGARCSRKSCIMRHLRRHADARQFPATETKPHRSPSRAVVRCASGEGFREKPGRRHRVAGFEVTERGYQLGWLYNKPLRIGGEPGR